MDGKLIFTAVIGTVLVAAAWTGAELQTGQTTASPQLIHAALSTPPYNSLPGPEHRLVANLDPVIHNPTATDFWAGTAWSGYFSERYRNPCGGKTACPIGGCDTCGCDADNSRSFCRYLDRFLQNLTLFRRRCTPCDKLASCKLHNSCSATGSDAWPTELTVPHSPEREHDQVEQAIEPMLDPVPEPMADPAPEPMDAPTPKIPTRVLPPRNPLPKTTSHPPRRIVNTTPVSYFSPPPVPLPPVLESPQPVKMNLREQQTQWPMRWTQPEKTILRFRMPAESDQRTQPQQTQSSLILSLSEKAY